MTPPIPITPLDAWITARIASDPRRAKEEAQASSQSPSSPPSSARQPDEPGDQRSHSQRPPHSPNAGSRGLSPLAGESERAAPSRQGGGPGEGESPPPTAPRLDRAGLEAWQLARLRRLLAHCKANSPFYARLLADAEPQAVRSMEDLAALPFTWPEDVRKDSLGFLCVSQDEIARVTTLPSSGTTGASKRFHFTESDLELTREFFRVGMSTLVGPGQTVLVLMPGERPGSVGHLLREALAPSGVTCLSHGFVRDLAAAVRAALEAGADCLIGVPAQVLAMARCAEGPRLRGRIGSVLLSGDLASDGLVRELERHWECRVHRHYGLTETGLGGAVECAARQGCHIREADLLVEIVDPADGRPRPLGEAGEIVITTLTRLGMPLVRYRTGDEGRLLSGACPCGSGVRRLEVLRGRLRERTRLANGTELGVEELDEALLPLPWLAAHQTTLERDGDRDVLRLIVHAPELEATAFAPGGAARAAVLDALAQAETLGRAMRDGSIVVGEIEAQGVEWLAEAPIKRRIEDLRTPRRDAAPVQAANGSDSPHARPVGDKGAPRPGLDGSAAGGETSKIAKVDGDASSAAPRQAPSFQPDATADARPSETPSVAASVSETAA